MPNDITSQKANYLMAGFRGRLRLKSITMADFRKYRPLITLLVCMMVVLAFTSTLIGAYNISATSIIAIFLDRILPFDDFKVYFAPHESSILLSIRLPRVASAVIVGGALGISGAVLQSLFRNPLAEPGLIGVSSGAALSAVAVIVFLSGQVILFNMDITVYILPIAAFLGGLATTVIVYMIGRTARGDIAATMLLIGVALNAVAMAGIGVLQFLSDDTQLRLLTFWMMGGLGSISWQSLLPVSVLIIMGCVGLIRLAVPLNAYLLGVNEARHLGIDIKAMTKKAVLFSALIVGAAVSVAGIIGFIGLIVPHLVRQVSGADNRTVIIGSALMGATLLLFADLCARTIIAPAELPVGLVTSAVGAPFFLWLLMRRNAKSRL